MPEDSKNTWSWSQVLLLGKGLLNPETKASRAKIDVSYNSQKFLEQ